ncbi:MAG: hypothetical protein ACPLRU_08965, partial [Desulfofundulus sp.]
MAVKIADVVRKIKAHFPELAGAPVYVGSPVCSLYGPCFLPRAGAVYVEQLKAALDSLPADMTGMVEDFLAVVSPPLSGAPPGIHLPEDAGALDGMFVPSALAPVRGFLAAHGFDPQDEEVLVT